MCIPFCCRRDAPCTIVVCVWNTQICDLYSGEACKSVPSLCHKIDNSCKLCTSVYLIFGLPLFLFGIIYGVYNWIYYSSRDIFTPTGTIMIITLCIILGFQLLLQVINNDIENSPRPSK